RPSTSRVDERLSEHRPDVPCRTLDPVQCTQPRGAQPLGGTAEAAGHLVDQRGQEHLRVERAGADVLADLTGGLAERLADERGRVDTPRAQLVQRLGGDLAGRLHLGEHADDLANVYRAPAGVCNIILDSTPPGHDPLVSCTYC